MCVCVFRNLHCLFPATVGDQATYLLVQERNDSRDRGPVIMLQQGTLKSTVIMLQQGTLKSKVVMPLWEGPPSKGV